jgi:hypothetical protein
MITELRQTQTDATRRRLALARVYRLLVSLSETASPETLSGQGEAAGQPACDDERVNILPFDEPPGGKAEASHESAEPG